MLKLITQTSWTQWGRRAKPPQDRFRPFLGFCGQRSKGSCWKSYQKSESKERNVVRQHTPDPKVKHLYILIWIDPWPNLCQFEPVMLWWLFSTPSKLDQFQLIRGCLNKTCCARLLWRMGWITLKIQLKNNQYVRHTCYKHSGNKNVDIQYQTHNFSWRPSDTGNP